ncbi:substrate-binding domain-containing protein [Massilia sp. TWR1-2-2]|uniref:substrate-binding domain-containing protein n=1 Tax=Massilia sp. TWR1-2-2 TaxID=2804584 RepID=UPI003CF60F34
MHSKDVGQNDGWPDVQRISLINMGNAVGQDVLRIYGPGGPAPAMKETATAFEKNAGVSVEVTAGPTSAWIDKAKQNADVIYSGSETMMTDFAVAMEGRIIEQTIKPLYLRPLAILVWPGNPKHITGVKDFLKPGTKILVVNGAGHNGVWEDMAGRKGSIETVRTLRNTPSAMPKTVPRLERPGLASLRLMSG